MGDEFETALLNCVASRLRPLGYEYDARLRVEDEVLYEDSILRKYF